MRSSTFLIATAAAVVRAQTPGDDVPINCAKPNANYCMEADIILRCDENAIGIPARCSPNLSGYPPAGGVASCWESGDEVGDAACEKNCIVYPEPPKAAFTLAADDCFPSHPHAPTNSPNATITTTITIPTTHCEHACTETHPPLPPPPPPSSSPPFSPPPVSWPTPIPTNGTLPIPTGTQPPPPPPPPGSTDDGEQPPPPPPTNEPGVPEEPTNVPIPPTTTGIEPIPTGAAAANKVGVLLAAAGFAAAYLL